MCQHNEQEQAESESPFQMLSHPLFQLRSLPIEIRWEVTRRHPYYLDWWKLAQAHYQAADTENPIEPLMRQAAVAILGQIGVSGSPPDPAMDFEEMNEGEMQLAWLTAAVQPIVMRGLIGLLIGALSKQTLQDIGALLIEAGRDEMEGELDPKAEALMNLGSLGNPELKSYLDEPIVTVNPAASGRQIKEAIDRLVKTWKEERNLDEKRPRPNKYLEYLGIWDMREGWENGAYHHCKERKLADIAEETKKEINTVHNQYRAAFELITGYSYSPAQWMRFFAIHKIMGLADDSIGEIAKRRPTKNRTARDVPESILGGASGDRGEDENNSASGIVTGSAAGASDSESIALYQDICSLVLKDRSDDQILEELDLSEKMVSVLDYARERLSSELK